MEKRYFLNKSYLRDSFHSRVKFGEKNSVPIDQSPSQLFNVDPATGRPMSDIQRLVKIQNDVAMQAQFSQLHEFKSNFLPSDMSDEDALKYQCPRLSQLPSELLEYKEKLVKWQIEEQQRQQAIKVKQEAEEADKKFWSDLKEEIKMSKLNK